MLSQIMQIYTKSQQMFESAQHRFLYKSKCAILGCFPRWPRFLWCFGVSLLEIKCPFCVKSDKLDNVMGFYLQKDGEGKLTLNRNHQYFCSVPGVNSAWCVQTRICLFCCLDRERSACWAHFIWWRVLGHDISEKQAHFCHSHYARVSWQVLN